MKLFLNDMKYNGLFIGMYRRSAINLFSGNCPGGWFQIGRDEFKSCFLYSGAAATYMTAVRFCQVHIYH